METQRIALLGATTKMGQQILKEALDRGHRVTVIAPDPEKVTTIHPHLKVVAGEIINKYDLASKVKGQDVIISTYNAHSDPAEHSKHIHNLIHVMNGDSIRQLVVMGHPGANWVEHSILMPSNDGAWKSVGHIQNKVLETLENETSFRWSYLYYPELEEPIGKNGKPAMGNKILVKSTESEQWLPMKDYAKAVLNEAEYFTEAHTAL